MEVYLILVLVTIFLTITHVRMIYFVAVFTFFIIYLLYNCIYFTQLLMYNLLNLRMFPKIFPTRNSREISQEKFGYSRNSWEIFCASHIWSQVGAGRLLRNGLETAVEQELAQVEIYTACKAPQRCQTNNSLMIQKVFNEVTMRYQDY